MLRPTDIPITSDISVVAMATQGVESEVAGNSGQKVDRTAG